MPDSKDVPMTDASTEAPPTPEPVFEPEPEMKDPDAPAPTPAPVVETEEEKKPVADPVDRQLDLCFLCDATGSMGQYIYSAQKNICSIVEKVVASEQADVRFALVSYRDHPPQDSTYVTKVFPFTADVGAMQRNVETMSASGGGDGPEAVTAALHDALHLPWRPNAAKVAVLIADAPPHGLEPTGDGFPNGDPEGRDPLQICREMAAHGITVYTVGCEPALGGYRFARDFMCTVAEITGGQAIALGSAALLADVIISGSVEEISLTLLQREVDNEIELIQREAAARREVLDEAETSVRVAAAMQAKGVRSKQMRTDGRMQNSKAAVWHKSPMQSLAAAKEELCKDMGDMDLEEDRPRGLSMRSAPRSAKCKGKPSLSASAAPGMLSRMLFGSRKKGGPGEECEGEEECEELCEEACVRSVPPLPVGVAMSATARRAPATWSGAAAPAPASATSMTLEENVITHDQVARMCRKSAMRSATSKC